MKKIRILLADDHPVVRAGVRAFLQDEPDMLVVGEASNAYQAVTLAQELQPDVAVVDISCRRCGYHIHRAVYPRLLYRFLRSLIEYHPTYLGSLDGATGKQ